MSINRSSDRNRPQAAHVWSSASKAWTPHAQAFALLGTLVGVFTMIVGVGPQTALDIVYHAVLLVLLLLGVFVAARAGHPLASGSGA